MARFLGRTSARLGSREILPFDRLGVRARLRSPFNLARLWRVLAKLARLGRLIAKLARFGRLIAKLARLGRLFARLPRLG
jgi:hypothetical protein